MMKTNCPNFHGLSCRPLMMEDSICLWKKQSFTPTVMMDLATPHDDE